MQNDVVASVSVGIVTIVSEDSVISLVRRKLLQTTGYETSTGEVAVSLTKEGRTKAELTETIELSFDILGLLVLTWLDLRGSTVDLTSIVTEQTSCVDPITTGVKIVRENPGIALNLDEVVNVSSVVIRGIVFHKAAILKIGASKDREPIT